MDRGVASRVLPVYSVCHGPRDKLCVEKIASSRSLDFVQVDEAERAATDPGS